MRPPSYERGTVSVEIVVMLPMFIALWFMVYFIHDLFALDVSARAMARGCAFQYALRGCVGDASGVDLCTGVKASKGAAADAEGGGVFAQFENWPLLGDAIKFLFGEPLHAHAEVKQDEQRTHVADLYLVCNPMPEVEPKNIAQHICSLARLSLDVHIPGCR
jgi:hypothetical protein